MGGSLTKAPDPAQLALPASRLRRAPARRSKAPRHAPGEKFLRGPVPMSWLVRASRLPGRALAVGIALWHLSGLKHNAATVTLTSDWLREMDIARTTGYRALKALETAGLVSVVRQAGRLPEVTLLTVGQEP